MEQHNVTIQRMFRVFDSCQHLLVRADGHVPGSLAWGVFSCLFSSARGMADSA